MSTERKFSKADKPSFSKDTQIEKGKYKLQLPISYEKVLYLKKETKSILDQYLYKWNTRLNGILIDYNNINLYKRRVRLVDDNTYFSLPISFDGMVLKPRIGEYILSQVLEIKNDKIILSIYNILKAVVYINTTETYISKSPYENSKLIKCSFSLSSINVNHQSRTVGLIESIDDESNKVIKIEEGKMIKVFIKSIILNSCMDVGLVCDIDVLNFS